MSRTANLRRQHDTLLEIVLQLQADIAAEITVSSSRQIITRLARLTGVLQMHLAAEDKVLYPAMMASNDKGTSAMARTFSIQMGDLGAAYSEYVERWSDHQKILRDAEAFRKQSAKVFAALGTRIRRENEELYPLADALTDSTPRAA